MDEKRQGRLLAPRRDYCVKQHRDSYQRAADEAGHGAACLERVVGIDAAAFLASAVSGYVTGQILHVNGGQFMG